MPNILLQQPLYLHYNCYMLHCYPLIITGGKQETNLYYFTQARVGFMQVKNQWHMLVLGSGAQLREHTMLSFGTALLVKQ